MSSGKQYLSLRPVGIKSKIRVYAAFFKGFMAKTIFPKNFITIGQFLSRDAVVKSDGMLFYARAHSEDLGYYAHTAKPSTFSWFQPVSGETVVDCGSSVGLFTMIGLKKGAVVYAFEANPSTFSILEKNIGLNRFEKNAHIFNLGLSSEPGEMTFYAPKHFTGTASFDKQWVENIEDKDEIAEFKVNVTTLDLILEKVERIDWLLIDVESFECRVLLGANEILDRTKRVIVEVSHNNREKVQKLFECHGFAVIDRGAWQEGVQYYLYERKGPRRLYP